MTTTAAQPFPVVLFFPDDLAARRASEAILGFTCAAWQNGIPHHEKGAVLLSSCERTLREHWPKWRKDAYLRIIALNDERFRDADLDAEVYAYLPAHTPVPLLERMVANALNSIRLSGVRQHTDQRLDEAGRQIDELNRIGAALSAEHDTRKLLEMILTKSRQITRADAGSLYLIEDTDGECRLRFAVAQNDSVPILLGESTMEVNPQSIAGYVALTGETVNLPDAYHLPEGVPYSINRSFDEASGYRTKSILAVPLRNQKNEMLGLVQLINCKRDSAASLNTPAAVETGVAVFTQRHQELATSLRVRRPWHWEIAVCWKISMASSRGSCAHRCQQSKRAIRPHADILSAWQPSHCGWPRHASGMACCTSRPSRCVRSVTHRYCTTLARSGCARTSW